eukprot:350869-Chlamydomonas_euryale.AAC.1
MCSIQVELSRTTLCIRPCCPHLPHPAHLAARHVEHAVGVRPHHMVAHHVLRVVAAALGRRRRRQWADTTPGGEHILAADLNPQVVRQRVQNPCDVRLAGRGLGLGEAPETPG